MQELWMPCSLCSSGGLGFGCQQSHVMIGACFMLYCAWLQRFLGGAELCGASVTVGGRVNHAYQLGEWFTPCFFSDVQCQRCGGGG